MRTPPPLPQVYVNFNDDFATAKVPSTESLPESPRITPLSVKAMGVVLRRMTSAGHAATGPRSSFDLVAAATAGGDAPASAAAPSLAGHLSFSLNPDGKSDSDSRRDSVSSLPRTLTAPVSLEDAKQLWARWSLPSFVARSLQQEAATALSEGGPSSACAFPAGRRASAFAGSLSQMSSRPSSTPPSLTPSKPPSRSITSSGPLETPPPIVEGHGP